jgi:hypothetical protein
VIRAGGCLLAIALLAWPIAAQAAPRVRLSYRAPEGCPDEGAFLSSVAAQAHPFERAPRSAARVRSLDAQIRRTAEGHAGLLRVREADGATSERDVRAPTCAEVFSALTLVTALAIDTSPPPPSPPPPEEPEPSPPEPGRWHFATAAHGGAFFAMAPSASWGVTPSIEAAPPFGDGRFDVRLGFTFAASPHAVTATGSAEFLWLAGRLEAGFLPLAWGPVSLRPTAGIGAGAIVGRGFSIAFPREQVRPWLDVTLGARAAITLVPGLAIELAGGLLVPITRDVWVFDSPPVTVHETPFAGAYLTAGARISLGR